MVCKVRVRLRISSANHRQDISRLKGSDMTQTVEISRKFKFEVTGDQLYMDYVEETPDPWYIDSIADVEINEATAKKLVTLIRAVFGDKVLEK